MTSNFNGLHVPHTPAHTPKRGGEGVLGHLRSHPTPKPTNASSYAAHHPRRPASTSPADTAWQPATAANMTIVSISRSRPKAAGAKA